jgi:DNA-directed RNA polymerase specialized sigma24 family protein
MTICCNSTSSPYLISRKRRTSRESNPPVITEPASKSRSPEAEAIARERQQQLWSAIREFTVSDRQVNVLYLEGMSAGEIEAVTGLTSGSIATRLTRIRHSLTARLRGDTA